jgi:hypothetical protein
MRITPRTVIAASLLLTCLTLLAQEKGYWRAASPNARAITGDIVLSDQKLTINFSGFIMSRIRALDPSELSAAFDADPSATGTGSLYRLTVPAAKVFLHKNTLCGGDETEWMATYAAGRSLKIAFFSGPKPPTLTLDAMTNSSDVCGVFAYAV